MKRRVDEFFAYARKRHTITVRRAEGLPRSAWTDDPILQKYRFTCVFRELDKTTKWFREHVRDPMRGKPEVMLATVVFRMFNRIEVGEAIFCQTSLDTTPPGGTAFDEYLGSDDVRALRRAIISYVGKRGPYATGAYIISSPPGYSKLDGILRLIGGFNKDVKPFPELCGADEEFNWRTVAQQLATPGISLEATWRWLREYDYLGNFHSYEIVTDLRHTALLERAPDVMTWANVGPGARRGANRVNGRDKNHRAPDQQVIEEMQELLKFSQQKRHWSKDWPKWELRDVEHTLCEFDKYERVRTGEGRPRGVYR